MSVIAAQRQPLWRRLLRRERILSQNADGGLDAFGFDLLGQRRGQAQDRRAARTNADLVAVQASIFAAVNFIASRVQRPRVILQQRRDGDWIEVEAPDHPAALHRQKVNASLTWAEALSVVATHKLTNGNAYWVKRRTATFGVPREFEIWNPAAVRISRDKASLWVPSRYEHMRPDGTRETVAPEDMVPFRGLIDPDDLLNGLSPITAVRLQADTSMEASRYGIKIFDQGGMPSTIFSADNITPIEARRQEDEIARRMAGTDNAHRIQIVEGDLKPVGSRITPRDMEFALLQKWTVIEVARAFDLSPLALKDFDRATYENAPEAGAQDWGRVLMELRAILNALNVHCIEPDFGPDLRLVAPGDDIPELQVRLKERAEIDKIHLDTGFQPINELRERDGLDPVPWGDEPFRIKAPVTTSVAQPGEGTEEAPRTRSAASARAVVETPSTANDPVLLALERGMARAWAGRLTNELRMIINWIEDQSVVRAQRDIDPTTVETYNWNWAERYGERTAIELAAVYEHVLIETAFMETPALAAQTLAEQYASARSGELMHDLSATTRVAVRTAVRDTIDQGLPLRDLKNKLRALPEFSPSRAEMVARTETAFAQGDGSINAARSQGRDEKRWMTSLDERVSPVVCAPNSDDGWIGIEDEFQSGHITIPGHPRCRCRVQHRTKRLTE